MFPTKKSVEACSLLRPKGEYSNTLKSRNWFLNMAGLSAPLLLKSSRKKKRKVQLKEILYIEGVKHYRLNLNLSSQNLLCHYQEMRKKAKLVIWTQLVWWGYMKTDPCGPDALNLGRFSVVDRAIHYKTKRSSSGMITWELLQHHVWHCPDKPGARKQNLRWKVKG